MVAHGLVADAPIRRATPAREMLATGDFLLPRLYGDPYLNKPPVFFWVIAGLGSLIGEVNVHAARLPSVSNT